MRPSRHVGQAACLTERWQPRERQPAVHERLKYFSDGELKQLRILPPGSRLEQGATYIDINNLRAYPAIGQPVCRSCRHTTGRNAK